MKNTVSIALLSILLIACSSQPKETTKNTADVSPTPYAESIQINELQEYLFEISSDAYQGRDTGEEGQKKAAQFLKNYYVENGIAPGNANSYFQEIPSSFFNERFPDSENVLAFIEGSEKPEEIVVLTAHYDHVGVDEDGNIYNGADDDGSGTVALMEMAEAFQLAKNEGNGPKRSILILHVTAEEKGLLGSKFYTENPIYPLENTVNNLNIDMIGRVDTNYSTKPENEQDYIYLIGADRLSSELHDLAIKQNQTYTNLELDFTYNAEDEPMRLYYRSDHYNFAKNNIPSIFFFSGLHEDYHQPTDTADKIDFELLQKRTQLVFYIAWEVANREERLVVDVAIE
ncbi:M28 family metallopeptidase [Psychroflexus salis]|uniref:Peptidase M28 n=1 Tax=Psychroflexus salis TaxID=1526574 RepID=A0A916ZSH2_9FLAO|nr:M28 family metallopeptidase [Psychroflexus salis]GGE11720.1 peptidase M28 [Psychroflexus salis]